jgi:Mab-21 protein
VPKPLKEAHGIVDAWRVNFYQFEKDMLRDYGKIKPAIKLVKVNSTHWGKAFLSPFCELNLQKLRDNQTWKSLFSYAIKTVAIWMKESGELSENDKIEIAFLNVSNL